MSELIKFPSHLKPTRVTPELRRIDETLVSPLSNAQQVISRGTPAWSFTYEYMDVSEEDREVLQSFLFKCKGPTNTFKVTDPGDYSIRGSMSDWIDVFSGYGSFTSDIGSTAGKVNSIWAGDADIYSHITEERILLQSWVSRILSSTPKWFGEGTSAKVSSLELGKAYAQRIKFWQHPTVRSVHFTLRVSSGGGSDLIGSGPATKVESTDSITAPFYVGNDVNSYSIAVRNFATNEGHIGDTWAYADYRLSRVALISNSENLFTESNNFSHADWLLSNSSVTSGYGNKDPFGTNSGAWRFDADTSVNTTFILYQPVTKVGTSDIYTLSVYGKPDAYPEMCLQIDNGANANRIRAYFNIVSGTVISIEENGDLSRGYANIYSLPNSWYRLQVTGLVNSDSTVRGRIYLAEGGSIAFTGTDGGNEVFGAQLRTFPFMGQYITTSDTAIVGTGWQTGSTIVLDGLDPGDIIKTGQRFEVVNRFYNADTGVYERSEFKRIVRELRVGDEGSALIEIEPSIRNAPVTDRSHITNDHTGETMHNPVIFSKPEMKGRLAVGNIQYTDKSLKSTDATFTIVEDLTE